MYKKGIKRLLDFIISVIALVVISPVFIVTTIILYINNKGAGAFFTQSRPGKKGKIFKVIKFKTMTNDQDSKGNLFPDREWLLR